MLRIHLTLIVLLGLTACGPEDLEPDDTMASEDSLTATRVSQSPSSFATTNGDILTTNIALLMGTRAVMIGGNFSQVTTPDGRVHAATNFAILDLLNPNRVIYAARGVNSYVRESFASAQVIYVAGDFTTFAGQPRQRLAAIGTVDLKLKSWNPGSSSRVEALTATRTAVFFNRGTSVTAVQPANAPSPGALIWRQTASGGPIRAMTVDSTGVSLVVGGLFEQVGSTVQHGLVKLATSNGSNSAAFRPLFRPARTSGRRSTRGQERTAQS